MSESGDKPGEVVAAAIEGDSELQAIRVMLSALVPLKPEARSRVVDYVSERLGMLVNAQMPQRPDSDPIPSAGVPGQSDIRSLTEEKTPHSANEMAALVAYYLSESAPATMRKQTINTDDIKTYFKQAHFKLPSKPEQTLVNAKNAGYLEAAGGGHYRLNPVGYNLVAHNLPSGGDKKKPKPRKTTTKKPRKSK